MSSCYIISKRLKTFVLGAAVEVSKFEDPRPRPRNSRARRGRGLIISHFRGRGEDEGTISYMRNSEGYPRRSSSFEDEDEGSFDHIFEDEARTRVE